MNPIILALVTVMLGVIACVTYFFGSNWVLDRIYPDTGPNAGRNINRANAVRPWLFMLPAIAILGLYLVYPVFNSIWLSMMDRSRENFVGLENYRWMIADDKFRESLFNNAMWLIIVPAMSTLFGLTAAGLTDRIWWGNIAKSLIFMPMAISFVGASVIWKFIYDYRGEDQTQIGLLNSIVTSLGGDPQAWITIPFWNDIFLMVILIWIQTGFAMVILSAALRGIPEETIEAAVLDGAGPLTVFFKIKIPQIAGTIAVVWTTITILVLKVFDIVFAMTNGEWGTQVLANYMYRMTFIDGHAGRGSAIALTIMVLVVPIMIWNIRNALKENA